MPLFLFRTFTCSSLAAFPENLLTDISRAILASALSCCSFFSSLGFAKFSITNFKELKTTKSSIIKGCEYNYINTKGEIVLPDSALTAYNFLGIFFEDLAAVKVDKKWGYINKEGIVKITPAYDDAYAFSDGLAPVKIGKKWGYIDKKGVLVVDAKYDETRPLSDGMGAVRVGHLWGFVNKDKKEVISPVYLWVEDFSEGFANVTLPKTRTTAFIDKTGTVKITLDNGEDTPFFSDGVAAFMDGFVDKTGKITTIDQDFYLAGDFNYGLAPIQLINPKIHLSSSDYFGFVSKNKENQDLKLLLTTYKGSIAKYAEVQTFSDGMAAVRIDSKWGFINTNGGEPQILPTYDEVKPFSNGLAAVKIGKKWGFIDKRDAHVTPMTYKFVSDFSDGAALVEKCTK